MPVQEPDSSTADYRRSPPLFAVAIAIVFGVALLALLPGPGGTDVQQPPSILKCIWDWLKDNKDSIAPLSQIVTSAGVVVAAVTFFRTQRMNRSEWFYKIVKEVMERAKKISEAGRYTNQDILDIVIFYSVLFSYYHYRLVGQREWQVVEKDLIQFARDPLLRKWLDPREVRPSGFPPVEQFDDQFIAYLKALQSREARS